MKTLNLTVIILTVITPTVMKIQEKFRFNPLVMTGSSKILGVGVIGLALNRCLKRCMTIADAIFLAMTPSMLLKNLKLIMIGEQQSILTPSGTAVTIKHLKTIKKQTLTMEPCLNLLRCPVVLKMKMTCFSLKTKSHQVQLMCILMISKTLMIHLSLNLLLTLSCEINRINLELDIPY